MPIPQRWLTGIAPDDWFGRLRLIGNPNVTPAHSSFTGRPFTSAYRCATSKARLSRACQMAPTDDPGVVAGRHTDCITGAVLDLGTVVHLHDHGNNSGKFYHYDGSEYPW